MSTVTATFERWAHGWELTVEGEDEVSTQSATLSKARQQVRDYLDTITPEVDHSQWAVVLKPATDSALADRVSTARQATQEAAASQERAARETRELVAALAAQGFNGSDIAAVLDVSRARAGQLLHEAGARTQSAA